MNTLIPSSVRLSSFAPSKLRRVAAVALLTLISSAKILAANGTPQPVVVTNPVEVLGSVEIVGEPFKQRFMVSQSGTIAPGYQNGGILIPLPAGKRIVIESIAVYTRVPDGSEPIAFVVAETKMVGLGSSSMALPLMKQGLFDGQRLFTAVTPVTMRISTTEHDLVANVFRGTVSALGTAYFSVSVYGYIEPL